MGGEAANVHLGTPSQAKSLLKDLDKRKADWVRDAAKEMSKTTGEHSNMPNAPQSTPNRWPNYSLV
jgi:hypothetical protein